MTETETNSTAEAERGLADLTARAGEVTAAIAGRPLDAELERTLNAQFPPDGETFRRLAETCRAGMAAGWLGPRERGGIRYGRAVEPGPETHGFSVDVVRYADKAGPHHSHPKGEIDMIVPIDPDATFDGRGAGWLVYGPGTAHYPTIGNGEAIVLYLLPDGEIAFTR